MPSLTRRDTKRVMVQARQSLPLPRRNTWCPRHTTWRPAQRKQVVCSILVFAEAAPGILRTLGQQNQSRSYTPQRRYTRPAVAKLLLV